MDANIIRRDAEIRNLLAQKITEGGIAAEVAHEALEHSYDCVEAFFRDLQQYGCISGMVGRLIYYWDTAAFFERHYDEIE